MNDTDYTLTSPALTLRQEGQAMLGLTIVWHPDPDRVGQQFVAAGGDAALLLNRYLPLFHEPGQTGHGLGHGSISREPIRIGRDGQDAIEISPPNSRMVLELNGNDLLVTTRLSREQIEAGVILGLGRTVLLCLHWMRCLPRNNPAGGWLGVGNAAIKTRELIRQVAPTDAPVLLLGETGSGKEVAAQAIHALSPRAGTAMVAVNMATLNESLAAADLFGAAKGAYTGAQNQRSGLFAEAQGSTLFLDEIGNTPANVQPMLLRVLECGQYRPLGATRDLNSRARLIAATDQDLYGATFNQALLRRLESFVIPIPPLRNRREDIGLLLMHLQKDRVMAGNPGLPITLVAQMARYDWPGNIRQLAHVCQRALLALQHGEEPDFAFLVSEPGRAAGAAGAAGATGAARTGSAGGSALGSEAGPAGAMREPVPNWPAAENRLAHRTKKPSHLSPQEVLAAMEQSHWNIQDAAQLLGISRPSLYKLLEQNPAVRQPENIDPNEIREVWQRCEGDLERCASNLKTPCEALRRHARTLGLGPVGTF